MTNLKLTVLEACEIAQLAYDLNESNDEWYFFQSHDTQCIIKIVDETAIVSFRGTSSIIDAITDARFFKTGGFVKKAVNLIKNIGKEKTAEFADIGKGSFHIGFRSSYECVRIKIRTYLKLNNVKHVYCVGHSLGASLATLCAYDILNHHEFRIDGVFLFGSPRVGNREFAKEYNSHLRDVTQRFVNCCDLVTRVPKIGYRHIKGLKYISRERYIYSKISWHKRMFDRAICRTKGIFRIIPKLMTFKFSELDDCFEDVSDHFLDEYKKALN